MVWDSCDVFFNRTEKIFYAGELITGTVVLEFKRKKKIERIDFKVIGLSKASWSRTSPTMPFIKIYSQKTKVYDVTMDIFRDLNGIKVKPGKCNYFFDFILPPNAPSTFKSSIATVNYFIQITTRTSCNRLLRKVYPLFVLGKVNLNHLEEYRVPTLFELSKELWNMGNISIYVKTYRGFSFQQKIPIEIIITNEKKAIITKARITLIQKRDYTVMSGYYNHEKEITKIVHTEFTNSSSEICKLNLDVPRILPSSLNVTDPMINISYIFRVEVFFLFHLTIHKDIPIVVSTEPVAHYPFTS